MIALLLSCLLQAEPEALNQKVRELAVRLTSESIEEREEAFKTLVGLGEGALGAVRTLLESEKDAEVATRLKAAAHEMERQAARGRVFRPAKPVSILEKEIPLADLVARLCAQTGAEGTAAPEIAARKVAFESKEEPLLQALDRLCAAQGDLSVKIEGGKVRLVPEKHVPYPTAYSGGYRVRLKRVLLHHVDKFESKETTVVLYLAFDAQPTLQPISASLPERLTGADDRNGEVAFVPVSLGQISGSGMSGNRGHVTVDNIEVPFDEQAPIDSACFLKEAPGTLKRLKTLRVKGKFRFATGTRMVSCRLGDPAKGAPLGDLPIHVRAFGDRIEIAPGDRVGWPAFQTRLEDLIDLETLTVINKEGAEAKCTRQYALFNWFGVGGAVDPESELRVAAYEDLFEHEVDFEFRDVTLRE